MAIKTYVTSAEPITAKVSSASPASASMNPTSIVPLSSAWANIEDKPFESVDGETLAVSNGVLHFKTGSYKDLSNLPSIEGMALVDDKSFEELGMKECSILDIEKMFT